MNQGQTIFDLPQAETVPAGSRYVVEMGDGTGTKSVTHEDVVKAVGGDLPLGDTKDLETVEKGTFVAAINEIKERTDKASGGAAIRVKTGDPGLYGRTVMVTDGETTLQGSMSYTGECVISGVIMNGNLTVSATTEEGATDQAVVYVSAYATYDVQLDTRQAYNWINVTTSEASLFDTKVTASNGEETATAMIGKDGTARIKFTFSGTVTVTATDGVNVVSAAVDVSGEVSGSYDVDLQLYKVTVTTQEASLEKQTVTLKNGGYTRTAVFSEGTATIVFDSNFMGECQVTATDGMKTGKMKFTAVADTHEYSLTLKLGTIFTALLDLTKSDPEKIVTYADDATGMQKKFSAWRNQEIFKNLHLCVLKDGKKLYELDDNNTAKKKDGTDADITTLGNDVMLELPERLGYMIEWVIPGNSLLKVSVTNEADNEAYEYDAFSLDSYNDCDRIYIGTFKGHCTGNKAYSSSGKAVTVSQTIDAFRTWCRARGTGYQQRTYGSVKLMQCLYIISHGTLNSQAAVGTGYVASSHSAGVKTGGTNAYGFDSELIRASNPSYMTDQNHQVKCLGLEDFWGNYWEFVDGLVSDASRNVLTARCAKDFNTQGSGYENNGNGGVSANIGNYMKLPQGGSKAGFTARDVSGSDSTYFTDYAALSASCLAIFGGYWNDALAAGAFRLSVNSAFSFSNASVGCRLMYMHKEEKADAAA